VLFLWIFLGLWTLLELFFKNQGSNCEIMDCGLILEKPGGSFCKIARNYRFRDYFYEEKVVDSVHGPSTTSGLSPRWTTTVRPRARWRARWSMARRRYGSPTVAARGGGGRGGRGSVGGALTRDGAVVKRSGDSDKAVTIEGVRWGRAPVRERRKGGRCEVRQGEAWSGHLL
jgi:hypothetical protein